MPKPKTVQAVEKTANHGNNVPIEVAGLRKKFGAQTVLNGINLRGNEGETVALLGPSGTGKSVLLKLLIGLQTPDAGSIKIPGEEITKLETTRLDELAKSLGFLFHEA